MQPNSSSTPSPSIHINPKFRVHINPNFLTKSNGLNQQHATKLAESMFATAPTQIYVNPRFFGNTNDMTQTPINTTSSNNNFHAVGNVTKSQQVKAHEFHETIPLAVEPLADTKIHTRTKIINSRAKAVVPNLSRIAPLVLNKVENPTKSLIKIGSKKLVRIPAKTTTPSTSPFAKSSKSVSKLRRPLQTKYKIVKEQTAFKIDRRSAKAKLAAVTLNVLPAVMSRKLWINESLTPTKTMTR